MVGKLYAIVAMRKRDRGIGAKNDLLYPFKEDLAHFKTCTMGEEKKGSVLIMGRKTFESLPGVLPKRHHMVVSHRPAPDHLPDQVTWCSSFIQALYLSQYKFPLEDMYVIGGASLYKEMWHYNPILIITHIIDTTSREKQPEADVFFPEIPDNYKLNTSGGWRTSMHKRHITYCIDTYHPHYDLYHLYNSREKQPEADVFS